MTTTVADLSKLLLSLYRTAQEAPLDDFQRLALDLIQPVLQFTSAQWVSGPHNVSGLSKRTAFLYNDPPNAAALYEEIKEQDTAAQYAWTHGEGVISYNIAALFRDKAHAGIRAYAHRIEHENVIAAFKVDTQKGFTRFCSFYRADPDHWYERHDCQLASHLVPHLWEALTINRLRHLARLTRDSSENTVASGIADCQGFLHYFDGEFAALLREEFGTGGTNSLSEACTAALHRDRRFVGRSIVIDAIPGADLLFLKARHAHTADRLTPREREVAKAIARGSSHKEIAQALSIAPATARNHIQAIHAKLRVSNAAELGAQIAGLL